jgi:uncharacterized protein with PQ loop repeat
MKIYGFIGMFFVQFSTCIQIWKLYQSKKPGGLSVGFLWMIFIGLVFYLVYALHIKDAVYITSNCVGLFFLSISIIQYYYYTFQNKKFLNNKIGYNDYYVPDLNDPYP